MIKVFARNVSTTKVRLSDLSHNDSMVHLHLPVIKVKHKNKTIKVIEDYIRPCEGVS